MLELCISSEVSVKTVALSTSTKVAFYYFTSVTSIKKEKGDEKPELPFELRNSLKDVTPSEKLLDTSMLLSLFIR